MEERLKELEDKLSSIETKIQVSIKWVGGILAVLGIVLGSNVFYVTDKINEIFGMPDVKKIENLADEAEKHTRKIRQLSEAGSTITIDGVCFKPRKLVRCADRDSPDHMTYIDLEKECVAAEYNIEFNYTKFILAECE